MNSYKKKLVLITSIIVVTIIVLYVGIKQYDLTKLETISTTEEFTVDNTVTTNCSIEFALEKFNEHMKSNYPNYKIIGDPIVSNVSNDNYSCIFLIVFNTIIQDLKDDGITQKYIISVTIRLYNDRYSFEIRKVIENN